MRKKTIFTILVALLASFCMVGSAMAANSMTNNSDKPIEPKSTCSQAGSISGIFDINTILHEGDVIRYLLDDGVTVCGNIDYFLVLADWGIDTLANGVNDPVQSTNGAGAGFSTFEIGQAGAALGNAAIGGASAYQIGFLVQATDGARTVSLTVAKRQTGAGVGQFAVTANSVLATGFTIKYVETMADDKLTVKLFDKNNALAFFFEPADRTAAPTIYDDDIQDAGDAADNVFCVNTSLFSGSLVHAIPESRPVSNTYQLTFLGDFIVQQLVAAVNYAVSTACKDAICNLIPLVTSVDQLGNNVAATGKFDFGDYSAAAASFSTVDRWSSTGYCNPPGNTIGNGLLFYKDGALFELGDQYQITMTLRVGTTADADKIIFDAAAAETEWWTTRGADSNCSTSAAPLATPSAGVWAFVGTPAADLATVTRGTFTIGATELNKGAILLDLPAMTMTLANVVAGEKIYLDVAVAKLPCGGSIATATICLGELVATCPTATNAVIDGIAFIGDRALTDVLHGYLGRLYALAANTTLFFPYAPALDDAGFFTGLSIANTGSGNVILTITLRDANGGTATYTTPTAVNSGTMWVNTLDSLKASLVDGATPLDTTQTVTVNVTAAVAP
jgi:hypothetical protein